MCSLRFRCNCPAGKVSWLKGTHCVASYQCQCSNGIKAILWFPVEIPLAPVNHHFLIKPGQNTADPVDYCHRERKGSGDAAGSIIISGFWRQLSLFTALSARLVIPEMLLKPLYTSKMKHQVPRGHSDLPPCAGSDPLWVLLNSSGSRGAEKRWGIAIMSVYLSKT